MGIKSKKKAKTRLDAYYRLAKDQGYRARSAFKLIQLNRKYDFLGKCKSLVDLGAAPGGWCQVAAKFMPVGSKIVGVDLVPMVPIRGVKTFVGDITEDKTRKIIRTYLKKEPVDCVVHDGAPNVGGVWSRDLFAQNALVLAALKLATDVLKAGGWFVSKVFRSTDYQKLVWVLKQFFTKVEATKPLASRMESAEIFVVCAGYKAPKTIDQRFFNASHIFSEVQEEKILTAGGAFITPTTNVPQGYDEVNTFKTKSATLSEFLDASDPKTLLKTMHEIHFEEDTDRPLLNSKHSKREIVYLCNDLQQVGDADRKRLLRWREQLIKERAKLQMLGKMAAPAGPSAAAGGDPNDDDYEDDDGEGDDDDDDEGAYDRMQDDEEEAARMTRELLELRKKRENELKKKAKKQVDRKLKQVRGLINYNPHDEQDHRALGQDMAGSEDGDAGGNDDDDAASEADGEWTVGTMGKYLVDGDVNAAFDMLGEDNRPQGNVPLDPVVDVNLDATEEVNMGDKGEDGEFGEDGRNDLTLHVEEGNEEAYDVDNWGNYVPAQKAERATKFKTPGVAQYGDETDEEDFDEEDEADDEGQDLAAQQQQKKQARRDKMEEKMEAAGAQAKWQRRHVNIESILSETFPKPKSQKQKSEKKKSRTEEALVKLRMPDAGSSDDNDSTRGGMDDDLSSLSDDFDDDYGGINEGRANSRKKKAIVPDQAKLTVAELTKLSRKQALQDNKAIAKRQKKSQRGNIIDVSGAKKAQREQSSVGKKKAGKNKKDNGQFEEIPIAMTDPDIRARTLAMATRMLDKRSRRDILEGGVNKYTHQDDGDLPDWFLKDEQRNCTVQLPVTAAEVDAQRQRFLALNNRPGKKVMEAMGRKRKRAQRMLRGMIEKGKNDPIARRKTQGLTVRKLMRSKTVKGDNGKKKKKMDPKTRGEAKRSKQREKKAGKGGKGGGKKGGKGKR